MAKNNKFAYKALKNAKVSLVALIILIVMIIFMVSPTIANAVEEDEVAIEFTKPAVRTSTTEFHAEEDFQRTGGILTIDRDAELYTLKEVLYQVAALDDNAEYRIIREDDKYILEVAWSRGKDVYGYMEILNVGEDVFICRGEDFRSMMMCAIMGVSM